MHLLLAWKAKRVEETENLETYLPDLLHPWWYRKIQRAESFFASYFMLFKEGSNVIKSSPTQTDYNCHYGCQIRDDQISPKQKPSTKRPFDEIITFVEDVWTK